jgi:hypothetical protein
MILFLAATFCKSLCSCLLPPAKVGAPCIFLHSCFHVLPLCLSNNEHILYIEKSNCINSNQQILKKIQTLA